MLLTEQRSGVPFKLPVVPLVLVAGYGIAPLVLALTAGIGNILLFAFVLVPLGILAGSWLRLYLSGFGQIVGGRLAGFRLRHAIVGSWIVRGDDRQPRFQLNRRTAGYSGIWLGVKETPVRGEDLLRQRGFAVLVAGGIALLLAVGLGLLLAGGASGWFIRLLTITVVLVSVGSLISLQHWLADRSAADAPALARMSALHALAVQSSDGIRPRDLDRKPIDELLMVADNSDFELHGWMISFDRALDQGDLEAAGRALDHARNIAGGRRNLLTAGVYRQAAFLAAWLDNDAEAANELLRKARHQAFSLHTQARIEVAVLLAAGDVEEATDMAMLTLQTLEDTLEPGMATLDEMLLNQILDRASAPATPEQLPRAS